MYAGLCIPNTLHKKPCRIGSGLCGTSENSLMTKFAEFRLSVVGWVVSSLIRVSIGTAHGPAHANGLGFFVGKGEMFQVLALPYVLLPTLVEDPYGAQSVSISSTSRVGQSTPVCIRTNAIMRCRCSSSLK